MFSMDMLRVFFAVEPRSSSSLFAKQLTLAGSFASLSLPPPPPPRLHVARRKREGWLGLPCENLAVKEPPAQNFTATTNEDGAAVH